ncbi:MAG: hypothetical protein LLG00_12145 [Planctomycetaceae bacterium]|nr:hypothetical protein [Planctomycetaceae bacterium]
MQEETPMIEPGDEKLSSQMRDPSGPPQAVDANDPVLRLIGSAGIVVVVVGGMMLALSATTSHTSGAQRSTKLQWEQRQVELKQAQAAQVDLVRPSAPPAGEGHAHD